MALSPRPTAIVLSDDSLAVGLYRGLMENGISPGRDISIIGRDSLPHEALELSREQAMKVHAR